MKIFVNEYFEIKAINSTSDESLTMYEIDRENVFSDKSDFIILNYCYKPNENGYGIYPVCDYEILKLFDIQNQKISILEAENADLRKGLQAILRGDMQSLAYVLYPEDFNNIEW